MIRLASSLLLLFVLAIPACTSEARPPVDWGKLPLAFEENRGQADARAQFMARGRGYALFLTADAAVLRVGAERGTVLQLEPVGAKPARLVGEAILPGKANYLIGSDTAQWVTDVPMFARVRLAEVYPGVALVYYGNQGRLEYDFIAAPGSDPGKIRLRVRGADRLRIEPDRGLSIWSGGVKLHWGKPVAYQRIDSKRKHVAVDYVVRGDEITFRLGRYDRGRELVIDPSLFYSTYLGGSVSADPFTDQPQPPGSAANNATGVAVDSNGNAYVSGITDAGDFPVTPGAFDTSENTSGCSPHGGCRSGFITKVNSNGTALVYSTYFGGGTGPRDIAVDSTGRAYVVGVAEPGLSGVPLTDSAFQRGQGCEGETAYAFLSVLNGAGNGLVYSTYYGTREIFCDGSFTAATGIAVGATGVAYVVGNTGVPDLAMRNAYQSSGRGDSDGWLAKFDPSKSGNASLLYATYLGGTSTDESIDVATEGGRAYVIGNTASADFPTTAAAFQRTVKGFSDIFIAKIDTNQSGAPSLAWSTLLGGSSSDVGAGIALLGNTPYLTGYTASADFPATAGVVQPTKTGPAQCGETARNCFDVFITKLNPSGSSLGYSTFLGGGGGSEFAFGIGVDGSGRAWVTGETYSPDFPVTSDAFQRNYHANICDTSANVPCLDAFLTGLSPAAAKRVYSTYFGGAADDVATGIAVRSGFAYLAGRTTSSDLPTTSGAFQRTRKGFMDAFVAKFSTAAGVSCSAPTTTRTIHLCQPVNGSTVKSPVRVVAAAKAGTTAIKVMQVYVDGRKKYEQSNVTKIDTFVPMAAGARRVTVQAIDGSGAFKSTVNITVQWDGT